MKKVVIIGGGFVGAKCAKALQKNFNVTLIDTKSYYEFTPGILRSLVYPEYLNTIQIPHSTYLPHTKIITGCVQHITDKEVHYDNKKINYDYLIIASGSSYKRPIKEHETVLASRGKTLHDYSEKTFHADSILIIGGGIVGVELAAEIISRYPDKKITIAHAGNALIERMSKSAQESAAHFLEKRNVTLDYGQKVMKKNGKTYISDKGKEYTPDLAFLCLGITPNSMFMKKTFSNSLDEKGYIKVTDALQLEGHGNIFAGGDVNNIREEKTAQNAEKHADVIIENIYRLEKNKDLIPYRSHPRVMVISLGRYNGILTYKNRSISGIIPGILKSLIEWKSMRQYS